MARGFLVFALMLPVASAAGVLEELAGERAAELRERRVLVLEPQAGDSRRVEGLVLFEQPRRRVLRMLSQTARQVEFRPELRKVETTTRAESFTKEHFEMRIMFMRVDYRLRTNFDYEKARIWWELDPESPNDIAVLEGFWELHTLDERNTIGLFGARVDVGPAFPTFLQDWATRKNMPKSLDNLRLWVNSNGSYRP